MRLHAVPAGNVTAKEVQGFVLEAFPAGAVVRLTTASMDTFMSADSARPKVEFTKKPHRMWEASSLLQCGRFLPQVRHATDSSDFSRIFDMTMLLWSSCMPAASATALRSARRTWQSCRAGFIA